MNFRFLYDLMESYFEVLANFFLKKESFFELKKVFECLSPDCESFIAPNFSNLNLFGVEFSPSHQ